MYNRKGELIPFTTWVRKGLANRNWLKWYGLVDSVKQVSSVTNECHDNEPAIFVIDKKNLIDCTTNDIYLNVTGKTGLETLYIPRIANHVSLSADDVWEDIYMYPFKYLLDSKSKDFQYRFLHDVVINRYWLEKWKIIDTNLCRLCKSDIENITHMFWKCEFVQEFWNHFNIYMFTKLNMTVNMNDVYLGKNETVPNTVIVNAKRYIYSAFCSEKKPYFAIFLHFLSNIIKMEQHIYTKKGKVGEWKLKWQSFIINDVIMM